MVYLEIVFKEARQLFDGENGGGEVFADSCSSIVAPVHCMRWSINESFHRGIHREIKFPPKTHKMLFVLK